MTATLGDIGPIRRKVDLEPIEVPSPVQEPVREPEPAK